MTRQRPFGVTLLAALSGLMALVAVIHTLQMLHLFPLFLGPVRFFTFDFFGAILWGFSAAIWIWVTRMLWQLDQQGWLFVVVLSALNLVLAVLSVLGASSLQAMLPSIVIDGVVLLYALLPGTRAAFNVPQA